MTIRKQMQKAMEMPVCRGMEEDIFFIGDIQCRTSTTWQQEAIARVRANEIYTSANFAGVGMTAEEVNAQEKWERILISLEGLTLPKEYIERVEI